MQEPIENGNTIIIVNNIIISQIGASLTMCTGITHYSGAKAALVNLTQVFEGA